jgi:hypothetical protein
VGQRIERKPGQRAGAKQLETPGAVVDEGSADPSRIGEGRHEKRVGPHGETGQDAGGRAQRSGFPPVEAGQKRRSELGHRGKRNESDLCQCGAFADRLVIGVGQDQNDGDGGAPNGDQSAAHVAARSRRAAVSQEQGQHQIVADHDGERHGLDDDHGGGGGEAADERHEREEPVAGRYRERQNVAVGVDIAAVEHREAGNRDRNHEHVDGDQVQREQPAGAIDVAQMAVLDDRDVELARQQQDGDRRQQGHGEGADEVGSLGEQRGDRLALLDAIDECTEAAEDRVSHEQPDEEEGCDLDQRFDRDRQDHPVLMLGRIDVAGAEQGGEHRHGDGDE